MDTLLQDLRFAIRTLLRSPGFSLAAVATLGLGIGANTAIFSVVDGVLLRPTPFRDVNRLAMVWETDRKSGTAHEPASVPDFLDFQQRSTRFQSLAAFQSDEVSLNPETGDPTRLAALSISQELLPTLGIGALVGRTFTREEAQAGGPNVVLISEDLWEQQYARDPGIIGRTIRLDDVARTVVGVLPRGADFGTLQILSTATYGRGFADRGGRVRVDVWLPYRPDPLTSPRETHPIIVLGRLAPGVALELAQQEMTSITADLERTYRENDSRGANVEALSRVVFGPVRPALMVLLGAVALVLLVACANVANLFLVRGVARLREVTVRVALGAGVQRLARQFLVEGAVLTLAGALFGVLLASGLLKLLLALAPGDIPRVNSIGIDARVLAVTLGLSVLVGLAFGILPTLQAKRMNLQSALRGESSRGGSSGRQQRRFRSALVVTELALAVVLMIGAGLLIKSLWRLQQVDPGFHPSGILKAEYQLPASRYPQDFKNWPRWPEITRFNADLKTRLAAIPGVEGVAIAGRHPLDAGFTSSIRVIGREAEGADWPEPSIRIVGAGYFETLGVPLVEGRRFEPSDDADHQPVIMINEAARHRFFANQEPIGQQIRLWGANRSVIGVVGNERFRGLAEETPPGVYLSLAQAASGGGGHSVLIRTRGNPSELAPTIRAVVREMDPALPLFAIEPLEETISNSLGQRRFTMLVLGAFAVVALLLATVGVHGVLSYAVTQRTKEIGVRMALGADTGTVRRLVVGQGAALALVGLTFGILGALIVTRVLANLLFGVGTEDPATFVAVALLLGGVGILATYLPARRAARVDPMVALRGE